MQAIFNIPDQSTLPKEQLNAAHGILRNGLSGKYMEVYCENAIKMADAVFKEWASVPSIDLSEAFSDLVASINVRNFLGEHAHSIHWRDVAKCMYELETYGTSPLAL